MISEAYVLKGTQVAIKKTLVEMDSYLDSKGRLLLPPVASLAAGAQYQILWPDGKSMLIVFDEIPAPARREEWVRFRAKDLEADD